MRVSQRISWMFTVQPSHGDNRLMFDDLDPPGLSFFHSHEIGLLNLFGSAGTTARVALDTGKTAATTTLRPAWALEYATSCDTVFGVSDNPRYCYCHCAYYCALFMCDFYCLDVMQLLVTINPMFVACGTVSLVLLSSDFSSPKTPRSTWRVLYLINYV
ncbi:hypothetical protein H9L39_11711 [Fusarium oxysporum f. sp. albedinis]|nr:hypothetical protein H9L39_11711 [Fusarium oxysporum f. sp. albedinis]